MRADELNELQKMYPDVDFRNKYVLFLKLDFYFAYISESIEGEVVFTNESKNLNGIRYKTRTPYVNKRVKTISMRNGQKLCNHGIPLVFDTYEELEALTGMTVKWTIRYKAFEGDAQNRKEKNITCVVNTDYLIKFKKGTRKRIYSYWVKDRVFTLTPVTDDLVSYFNGFSKVVVVLNANDEDLCKLCKVDEHDMEMVVLKGVTATDDERISKLVKETLELCDFSDSGSGTNMVELQIMNKTMILEPAMFTNYYRY